MRQIFSRTLIAIGMLVPLNSYADLQICARVRTGNLLTDVALVRLPRECPGNTMRITQISDVYGDGSGRALNINSSRTLDGIGREHTNITIAAGTVLRLRSGSMLRCTGELINNGTIEILPGAFGGTRVYQGSSLVAAGGRSAHPGAASPAPASDGLASFSDSASPGPSQPEYEPSSTTVLRVQPYGGGGGGSGASIDPTQEQVGGTGGGSAYIYCEGGIVNRGTITAVGTDGGNYGGGGGAGGLLVLGSQSTVTNRGTINLSGGNGAAASLLDEGRIAVGAGGGGAGGLMYVIAPTFNSGGGEIFTIGGVAGSNAGSDPSGVLIRVGGGQGGSLFANGGRGGIVSINSFGAAERGSDGTTQHLNSNPLDMPIGF